MTYRSIKSSERTLRLFELFSRRQRRLTLTEIARGLAIPQASASMLTQNLLGMGYLDWDRQARTFAPTIRVALLGGWVGPRLAGVESLASRLDRLHQTSGEAVHVGILNGAHVQMVQARNGEDDEPNIDSGQLYPLTRAAVGHALLATKPDREVQQLVRRCNAESPPEARAPEADVLQAVAEVRRTSYAITVGLYRPDQAAVATSFAAGGEPFAIGFGGRMDRIGPKRPLLIAALDDFRREAGLAEPRRCDP